MLSMVTTAPIRSWKIAANRAIGDMTGSKKTSANAFRDRSKERIRQKAKLKIERIGALSLSLPDLFNQLADAFRGLQAGVLLVEGFGEVDYLLPV
jgi:hypothetical protein